MKFLSDILAKAGLTVDGVVTLNNTATGQTPDANDNSTKLATTAWVRTFVQPYSLPIASASILGGVKVGSGLSINSSTGVLSVVGASAASIKSTQTFVVTEGQTVFTVTGGYTPGLIDIFLNGVYLSPNQTVATNGTTFTINDPAATGDVVDVIVASAIFEGSASTTDQLPEGSINLYYTNTRARAAITLTTTGVSGAAIYNSSTGVFNIPNYQGLVPAGGVAGDILAKVSGTNYDVTWIPNYTSQVQHIVKAGVAVTKGQAVYVSSADGTNMIVSKASNASEGTSSKTLGLVAQDLAINGQGFVVTEGLLAGLDTSTAQAGDPVWLGTNGNLIFGLLNKPTAPAHLVFIGIVTRVQSNNGEIFVKVQNGFELDELHNLSVASPSDGDMIKYVASTGLWTKIAATTTNITEGTNLYYTQARFDTAFAAKSTTNLAEGTNLYYTNARARAAISVTGSGSYDSATGVITVTGGVTSVNTLTGAVTLTTTNIGEGTNLYYTTARVNSDFDTRLATKSTTNITEGTNLYYTDARVGTYLTANSYATQSYVSTQINNLVSGAPGLLDTLDELAAALGDDPNFATTVSTALSNRLRIDTASQGLNGTQQSNGRTNLGLGSLAVLSSVGNAQITDVAWSKVTGAPAFITSYTEVDTLASVTGRGATTSSNLTFSGQLTLNKNGTQLKISRADTAAADWFFHSWASGINIYPNAVGTVYFGRDGSATNVDVYNGTLYQQGNAVWHAGNLTNLNQLTNGPGYITSYTETDTLASVTGRGASTSTAITISGIDSALKVQHDGTSTAWRGRLGSFNSTADKASFLGNYTGRPGVFGHNNALSAWAELYVNTLGVYGHGTLYLSWDTYVKGNGNDTNYNIWHSGNLSNLNQLSNGPGYITSSATTLTLTGNLTVSSGNTTGGGIILADDGDIVDLNDAYCSMRFSAGVRIFSANRGGSAVITLSNTGSIAANGPISASNISSSIIASYIVQRDANGYIYANHVNFNTSENENPAISSFITSNGDGWSRKSSLAHVKNSIRGVADGTWGINITGTASQLGGYTLQNVVPFHSGSDFADGTLVVTNINAAVTYGDSFVMEVTGKSYGSGPAPFALLLEGYIYADTFINVGAISYGSWFPGPIKILNYNGNLAFWWPRGSYWNSFSVTVREAGGSSSNRVTSVGNSTEPASAKKVSVSVIQSLNSNNYNSYAPTLTGGGASGSWNINAASVGGRTVGNGKGNIGYFDASGNLYINNPESYSGEVRLGAAWSRGGIYTSSTLSLNTGSSTIDMVYSDATRFRYYYDSNGSRFMVNTTSTPYTLIDSNARPVIYARGAYPVLTLDHTETSNTNHGPTIQFSHNGLDSRQWVIGSSGNGSRLDFGMSNAAYGNSNYNPHHGIAGYQGKTVMRITETGVLVGDAGSYPTVTSPTVAMDVRGSIRLSGTLLLSGSGAEASNSTGARLTESYGPVWNLTNGATWHHQVINGSYLSGFNASGGNFGNGNYYGTGDVTAYYSDERLKTKINTITDAIEKIKSLEGFVYVENELARSLGYTNQKEQAGVSAQQIQAVLPQAVSLAPFDMQGIAETGEVISKTGENYLTVKYDRIVPLLIEGIKEQQTQIESQKSEIEELKDLVKQLINR